MKKFYLYIENMGLYLKIVETITIMLHLKIQKHIVGVSSLSGAYFTASDINGDGKVNSLDLLYVQKYIVKIYDIKN